MAISNVRNIEQIQLVPSDSILRAPSVGHMGPKKFLRFCYFFMNVLVHPNLHHHLIKVHLFRSCITFRHPPPKIQPFTKKTMKQFDHLPLPPQSLAIMCTNVQLKANYCCTYVEYVILSKSNKINTEVSRKRTWTGAKRSVTI